MKTVVVEGWRFIPHSYAMVNQHQCLELLKRPEIRLFHRDVPLAAKAWRAEPGLFSPAEEERLRSITKPPPGLKMDAVLRMGWPHYFHNDPDAGRTFVWATSEVRAVHDVSIGGGRPAKEVLPTIPCQVIACSRWAADGFVNSGAPPSRLSVVPCGVDPDVFRPAPSEAERTQVRKRLGWEGRFVMLNVSAMTQNKGVVYLLKAAAALAGKIPDPLIVLKGIDSLYTSQQMARDAVRGLTREESEFVLPRMTYTGATLPADRLVELMQAADVYVSPYMAEGFNLPVLESAACGLPVICTRGGSTDDFADDSWCLRINSTFRDGVLGKLGGGLVPDQEHLNELIRRFAGDAAWRESARAAGPEWVRSRFTWKHSVDRLLGVMFPEGV